MHTTKPAKPKRRQDPLRQRRAHFDELEECLLLTSGPAVPEFQLLYGENNGL
jgi:hypothetical protein